MKKTIIVESRVFNPHPIFPLATKAGPFLFMSGQSGLDPVTGLPIHSYNDLGGKRPYPALGMMAPDSWEEALIAQSARAYENLDVILRGHGGSKESVLFYSIYLRDMRNFPVLVRARSSLFEGGFAPPSTASQVPDLLLPEALVYFDPIALVPHEDITTSSRVVLNSAHLNQGPLSNYQLGTRVGAYLFFAGIVAAYPETDFIVRSSRDLNRSDRLAPDGNLAVRLMHDPVAAQTHCIYEFFGKLLAEQGARLEDLLKINIYVRRMADLPAIENVSRHFLKGSLPAASIIGVQTLAMRDFLIEIEGIALVPGMGVERRSLREIKGASAWGHHAIATVAGGLAFVSALVGYDSGQDKVVLSGSDLEAAGRAILERALGVRPPCSASEVAAAAQAASVFRQLERVLASVGSSLSDTLKITVHLREMRDFAVVQEVARVVFEDSPPALTVMAVDDLPLAVARLQVEAFAVAAR